MTLDEAYQLLDQNLMHNNPVFLKMDDRNEVLVVCSTDTSQPFSMIENVTSQAIASKSAYLQSNTLSDRGIEQLGKILEPVLPTGDMASQIAWRRFTRQSNVIMVLDDDQVILRVMGHMLKNYGQVETFADAKEFLSAYQRLAPNIVFLDIHLQGEGERGTNVASLLCEKVDPGAYPVMISADAVKTNVIESKFKGAKGFIGKPVNADALGRHVMGSPMLYQRY
ncbi:MAG TPA: response regulator [Alphaproteobacteria bacterium]